MTAAINEVAYTLLALAFLGGVAALLLIPLGGMVHDIVQLLRGRDLN